MRKQGDRYYCFYSGGRWETESYGVDYGVADHVLGPYSDSGNDSIALHPDSSNEYLVYHAWDPAMTARRMCIDRLLWTTEGPRCDGPT